MSALIPALSPRQTAGLGFAAVVAGLLALCVSVVPDSRQAVVLRMGQPVRVINRYAPGAGLGGGGLVAHWPGLERVVAADRTPITTLAERQPVRGSDGMAADLDLAVEWRVIDPARLATGPGSEAALADTLRGAAGSLAQAELARVPLGIAAQPGGGGALARIAATLDARARPLGGQVLAVRIARLALSPEANAGALARMRAEPVALAAAIEADGARTAQQAEAAGEANAARILAQSAGRDPAFYDFYRAMKSYDAVLASPQGKATRTIVIPPESEYLRQFHGGASFKVR